MAPALFYNHVCSSTDRSILASKQDNMAEVIGWLARDYAGRDDSGKIILQLLQKLSI